VDTDKALSNNSKYNIDIGCIYYNCCYDVCRFKKTKEDNTGILKISNYYKIKI
jgi:hypothetical protein